MPTFDDESPSSIRRVFKTSKRASRISKVESIYHREAAIRRRFAIDDKSQKFHVDLIKIYENLAAGKFPTNEQLCQGLQRFSDMISTKGSGAMQKEVIDNLVALLDAIQDEKNNQSEIQRVLYHLRLGSKSFPATDAGSKLKDLISDRSFVEGGKDFLTLLITSSDFRDIMSELSQTSAEFFSKTEQTSTESVQKDIIDQVPKESRDMVIRLLNLIDEISENKEYQEALHFVLLCIRKSERKMKEIVKSGYEEVNEDDSNKIGGNLSLAKQELKNILEKVANRSTEDVERELLAITNKLKEDYKLRNILDDLVIFVGRSLRDEEFRNDPDTILTGSNLIDQTRSYVASSCGESIQNLFKNLVDFLKAIQDDAHVQRLSLASKSLFDNFYYKIGDRIVLNQELVNDLIVYLLPNVLNQLRLITIPSIKTSTEKYDFQLEKFELSVDDVLPSYIEAKLSKGIVMGIRDQIADQKYSSMSIVLHELHIDVSSIPFSYKVKSLKLQDRGTLDLQTQKTGISLNLKLHYYAEDTDKTLEIENSDIFVDKIKLNIQGRHRALYWILSPTIKNMIRSQFTTSLSLKIREYVKQADKIVTARKVQYKRSNATIGRQVREKRRAEQSLKDSDGATRETNPWETNIFDLTYV